MMARKITGRGAPTQIWTVGCSCGWLCQAPLRGQRTRAVGAFNDHMATVETLRLGGLMRQVPRGAGG
jgi:hypothetical protein